MQSADLSAFLNNTFKIAIIVGAMLAVARILYAGFLYMGSDSWTTKDRAKGVLWDAVVGLVLLLSIVLILRYINPNILKFNLTTQEVSSGPQSQPNTTIAPTAGFGNSPVDADEINTVLAP